MTITLTAADFDRMMSDDRWLGYGYLGERRNRLEEGDSTVAADALAVAAANELGLTYDEVFHWANSKDGRWFGDCMFGANGSHAEKYLPAQRHARQAQEA